MLVCVCVCLMTVDNVCCLSFQFATNSQMTTAIVMQMVCGRHLKYECASFASGELRIAKINEKYAARARTHANQYRTQRDKRKRIRIVIRHIRFHRIYGDRMLSAWGKSDEMLCHVIHHSIVCIGNGTQAQIKTDDRRSNACGTW